MDCENFKSMLEHYEELNDVEKIKMAEHAELCDSCAEELAQYLSMVNTLKSMPKLTAPDNFLDDLNYRIDSEDIIPEKKPFNLKENIQKYSYRYGAVAACLALVAVVGVNSRDMVNKMMQNDSDGVISEVTSSAKPDAQKDKTKQPSASPKAVPSATPQATPNMTEKPKPTSIPQKANAATPKPLATAVPNTSKSKTTVAPVTRTPSNEAVASFYEQSSPVQKTEKPQANKTDTDNVQAEATEKPMETPQARVMNPDDYQLPDVNDSNNKNDVVHNYKAASNSIEVSYAYADKAREILNEYAIGSDGATYYSMNPDKVDECLQAMSDAGIEFNENCIEMDDDTVIFRLIIS